MAPKKGKAKKTIAKKPKTKKGPKSYTADANNDGCVTGRASNLKSSAHTEHIAQPSAARCTDPLPRCDRPVPCSTTTRAEANAVNVTITRTDLNDDGRTTRAEARAARKAAYGRLF